MSMQGFCLGALDETKPNERTYHSRLQLLDGWHHMGCSRGMKDNPNLGFDLSPVLRLFLNIHGVAHAHIEAYKVVVTKGELFSWSEIEVHIAEILMGVVTAINATNEIERMRDARASDGVSGVQPEAGEHSDCDDSECTEGNWS